MVAEPHTEVVVVKLPPCDVCGDEAHYDAKTTLGPWGYLCQADYDRMGMGLGLGMGQRLILATDTPAGS